MPRCILPLFILTVSIVTAYDTAVISLPTATREELSRALASTNNNTTEYIGNPFPSIVGGSPADDDEFPWFGRTDITFFNNFESAGFSCGASLIHSDMVVSAAHCIADSIPKYVGYAYTITFYLGANAFDGSDGIALEVQNIYYPTNYDFPTNDIILYKLRTATDVTPVAWNTNPLIPFAGDIGTAIGFGLTSSGGDDASTLLKVDLPAITNVECSTFFTVPASVTCTYAKGQEKDICEGDSGGPILTENGILYGITSFGGDPCATTPSGFTRTSSFNDFMTKVSTFICIL